MPVSSQLQLELAATLGQLLLARGATVTTAESCTGGGVAEAITSVAGSSRWFNCSFITYSNGSKRELLGVPEEALQQLGAVSEQVVLAMAQGALARARAEFSVAISGIAGPEGGTAIKPVGTVWLAWVGPGSGTAQCFHFAGDRQQVRQQAVLQALRGLIDCASTV